jgi:predicted amidohydrolase YtcJ
VRDEFSRVRSWFLLAVCVVFVSASLFAEKNSPADTIITNARVYTVNAKRPWADAVAIRGDRIVAAGTAKEINALRGPSTKVIDGNGHVVLPGFTDCHIHFMHGSLGLTEVDLNGADTVAEIQKRVKEYATAHPDAPWIEGMGWQYPTFGPTALPNKKLLDDVMPDRPVFLTAYDGHTTWANSKALAMAGVTRDTSNPPNGIIVKDEAGEPTGALKEHASSLVRKVIPQPTREERLAALRKGLHEANRWGLTRVHSAGGDFEYLDLYDELRKQGQLTVRMTIAYFLDPPAITQEAIEKIEGERRAFHDDWITGGSVKTMLDGVVESHTAAMLTPYSDDPSQIGKPFWDDDKYKQAVAELDQRGIQVFTHAIGDRAVRLALDAYENAASVNHTTDRRHRIEHIETITAQDIPRFGKLGVIPSYQPLHAEPNEDTLEVWARNAGPDRASRAWTWQSVAKTGGRLAFGSDWPVVTLNPWTGVQNAVTRQTRQGKPEGGWLPQERVSLEQAIKGYTLGAAYAGHREKDEGSIESGKLADLIMLKQDLFKAKPSDIADTEVLMTMVGGKIVYEPSAAGGK